jgi:hypothetical protein
VSIFGQLAKIVLVAGRRPRVKIARVESCAVDGHVAGLGIDLPGRDLRPQGIDPSTRADDQGITVKAVRAVQPQGQLAGDIHPQRNVMAFPRRGVVAGELVDQALAEKELKELGLRHVRGQFEIIEPSFAKFVDHVGLVVFERD